MPTTPSERPLLAGGCLCGAVRWHASASPRNVHHCHCGMCRRWTGSGFATLVWFSRDNLSWDGAAPALFRSSPIAVRSHCGRCGTPLALTYVGTLDDPAAVTPRHHYGVEGRLPWVDIGKDLPGKETRERW